MKKIILICLLFLLTGCTINYDVKIEDDTVLENINIDEAVGTFPVPAYINEQGASEEDEKVEGVNYYDITFNNNNTIFKYTFPLNQFKDSTAANTCLKKITFDTDDDGNNIINTTGYYSCMDLYPRITNINIRISLNNNYEVISNNADSKDNNLYIWNVTQENYQDKHIQLIFKNKKESEEKPNENVDNNKNEPEEKIENKTSILTYIFVLSAIALFLLGIFGYIKYKSVEF